MTDLLTQLRNYGKEFTAAQEAITMKQVVEREPAADLRPTPQRKGWVIALASAMSVFVLIGGLVLGWQLLTDGGDDVTTDSTTTTEAPTTTAAPETTAVPETTTTTAAPFDPTTAPPPYEGPVPELGIGWVQEATEPGPPIVSHPDLGFVAFGERETEGFMTAAQAFFSPNGSTWEAATEFDAPEGDPGDRVRFAAASEAGFVAALSGHAGPTLFFSVDGLTWEELTQPWQGGGFAGVASGPAGHALVGADASCNGFAAFSPDGQEWTTQRLEAGCAPAGAAWTGSGYVVVSALNDGQINEILLSVDGSTWDEIDVAQPPGPIGAFGVSVAGTADTLVIAGSDLSTTPSSLSAWYSFDQGVTWLEAVINEADDAPAGEYQVWEMIHSDLGYLAVGAIETLTDESPGFILWSPNGAEWFQFITDDSQDFLSIGVVGDTAIATGFGTGLWSWTGP